MGYLPRDYVLSGHSWRDRWCFFNDVLFLLESVVTEPHEGDGARSLRACIRHEKSTAWQKGTGKASDADDENVTGTESEATEREANWPSLPKAAGRGTTATKGGKAKGSAKGVATSNQFGALQEAQESENEQPDTDMGDDGAG